MVTNHPCCICPGSIVSILEILVNGILFVVLSVKKKEVLYIYIKTSAEMQEHKSHSLNTFLLLSQGLLVFQVRFSRPP